MKKYSSLHLRIWLSLLCCCLLTPWSISHFNRYIRLGERVRAGLNFINVLHTAFTHVDPKSVKRCWRLDCVLTLWGATGGKAASKYVDEIDARRLKTIKLVWLGHHYHLQRVSRNWWSKICLWWFGFWLKIIFTTAPAASKKPQFKSFQILLKNNHLALLHVILIRDTQNVGRD